MRTRIANLEREAQDLHSKLDMEKHGARLDPLTGVANRKSFDERFAQEIFRRREPACRDLLLWDLDNFKAINDTYGHRAGDRVLQNVATCFMAALRANDFVARIGGEEFAMLLSGLTYRSREYGQSGANGGRGITISFSRHAGACHGVVRNHRVAENDAGGTAFDRADAALYRAKHSGKNTCIAA